MELSVSILNSKNRQEMIKVLNNTDIEYIHLDVMDGNFVSQNSLDIEELKELIKLSNKNLDIHLMVSDPMKYIEAIKEYKNIKYVTIHLEINKNIKEILSTIKSYGYKVGLSIKPNTDVKELLPYLNDIDMILLMTVEPGLGGQEFLETSQTKLKELKKHINYNVKIEVDGGINDKTLKYVETADIIVVGSYITTSDNPLDKINSLKV